MSYLKKILLINFCLLFSSLYSMENASNQQEVALFASRTFALPRQQIMKWLLIAAAYDYRSARELIRLNRNPLFRVKPQNGNQEDQGILFNKDTVKAVQEHARYVLITKLKESRRLANKFKTLDIYKINDNAGKYGSTWLMNVAEILDVDLVDIVLTLGANPDLQDRGGYTAAHSAIWARKHPKSYDKILGRVVKRNAILNLLRHYNARFGIFSSLKNTRKQSPFLGMIERNYDECNTLVNVLIKEQPELFKQLHDNACKENGTTILGRQIEQMSPSLNSIKFLINHGVSCAPDCLAAAPWIPEATVLKLLISSGLDIFTLRMKNGSLLHNCIHDYWINILNSTFELSRKKTLDKITLLVIHGLPSVPDNEGTKAIDFLRRMAQGELEQNVQEIYQAWNNGIDEKKAICKEIIAIMNRVPLETLGHELLALSKQPIPLDPQLKERRKQLIARLMHHGANCTLVDEQGYTAAMNAAAQGDTEVYDILKDHLRSKIIYDKLGRTAAQIFQERQDADNRMDVARIMVGMHSNNNNESDGNMHVDEPSLDRQIKRHKISN